MVNIPTGLAINTATSADRTTATGMRNALSALLRGSGGVPYPGCLPQDGNQLLVQSASTSALTFSVSTGYAVVIRAAAPTLGGYIVGTPTAVSLTLTAANATNPRIDVVYICQPDPEAGDSTHARIDVLVGTPAATPTVPTGLPQGSLALAQVRVPAAATAASACTITDVRTLTAIQSAPPVYLGSEALLPTTGAYGALAVVTAPTAASAGTGATNVTYRCGNGSVWRPWDSEWISFTPGVSGPNGAQGASPGYNFTVAQYRFVAGKVRVRIGITLNGGTAALTGQWQIFLPINDPGAVGRNQSPGQVKGYKSSTGAEYLLVHSISAYGGNILYIGAYNGTNGQTVQTSATVPFTWGQSDSLDIDIEYDIF